MNSEQYKVVQRPINLCQRNVFSMDTLSIRKQPSGDEGRIRIFFTGRADVSDTFLLNMLRNRINRCYTRNVVKVSALIGAASRLIVQCTIHSLLELPVQKDGRSFGILLLTGNYHRIMRQQ